MKYVVKTFRDAGLEARWSRTRRGEPMIIVARCEGGRWYAVTKSMWDDMHREGIQEAFYRHTLLGEFFSVPV